MPFRLPIPVAVLAIALAACGGGSKAVPDAGDGGGGCESRADCPAGEICQIPDGGSQNACLHCTTNGDCEAKELCGDAGLCGFRTGWGDQCTLNSDCLSGQLCDQGLCLPPDQVTLCQRGNCGGSQVCNVQNQVCEENLGCVVNANCSADQVCNPVTLQCEPRCDPSDPGQVCQPTQQCVNDRCVDCTKDADCGLGLTCDVLAGRCSAPGLCFSDQTCPAGQVCNLATETCGPPPAPCTSDDGCPSGLVCDLVSGECVTPVCQADQFAPNQTMSNAPPIQPGASYTGLTLCGASDVDWYAIALLSGDELQVTINTNVVGSGYSFDVKMISDAGTIIADGPNLILNGIAPATGTYFLEMTDGDPDCLYGFSTLVSHGVQCPSNPFGDIGDISKAASIDGGVGPIWLCAGQEDWFAVDVPASGLSVTLGCDPTQGPLGITATLADGGVVASSNSGAPTQTILVPSATPSPAYLEITGDGQQNNAYTLSLAPAGTSGVNNDGPPPPHAGRPGGRDR